MTMTETPMIKQYKKLKSNHSDSILFFRLGDFYEMFYDDAICASKELSLTLTGRGKDPNRIPMCGVPFHAAENYISKLVKKGYKVAVCEQFEEVGETKGPTHRDVVRIITPGTAQIDTVYESNSINYLASICKVGQSYGLAYVDVSTGQFKCDSFKNLDGLQNELRRLDPRELLVDDSLSNQINHPQKSPFFPYEKKQAEAYILNHFKIKATTVFQIDYLQASYPAIVAILEYLNYTQKGAFSQIQNIKPNISNEYCYFDQGVIEHLDLFDKQAGLYGILNQTKTSMGARKLKEWIRYPLINPLNILKRQQKVTGLIQMNKHQQWSELVHSISDIERVLGKICAQYNNPRDMIALRGALTLSDDIVDFVASLGPIFQNEQLALDKIMAGQGSIKEILNELNQALLTEVPTHCRDGGIFKQTYNQELSELCDSFQDIRNWIKSLEPSLKDTLDIKSLKVGFNKVFGYYIEIPNAQKDKVPSSFIRKQTLTNAERYITSELKEKETIILTAKDQQAILEKKLFEQLREHLESYVTIIQEFATIIAEIDAILSLAESANKYQFSCPNIINDDSNTLVINGLWHPMVAQNQIASFIRNDIALSNNTPFVLITGPNMAGKSTLMRSVAICVIMGQIGSYVPAEMAHFSIIESLYTRIGANDKLAEGQSTFMVEMVETATICQNATSKSLIILDEIGRGTSTFDGVSIAASVSEYLINHIKARTLFATHYHELTALSDKYPQIQNASMQIKDNDKDLVFTYKLIQGAAEKSYGVMVAKMAGLPKEITLKAEEWLNQFEKKAANGDIVQLQLF